MQFTYPECPDCVAERRESALGRVLDAASGLDLIHYFGDLLESGHTVREAITAIETVWADMA